MTYPNLPKRFSDIPEPSLETKWFKIGEKTVRSVWVNILRGFKEAITPTSNQPIWEPIKVIKIIYNILKEDEVYQRSQLIPEIFLIDKKFCLLEAMISREAVQFERDLKREVTKENLQWIQIGRVRSNGYYFLQTGLKLDICIALYNNGNWIISLTDKHKAVIMEKIELTEEKALACATEFYRRMFCTHDKLL